MAISRTQQVSAAATSATIAAPTRGDLILVCAYRSSSATPASLPAGYTNIASAGANTNSMRVGYKWSDGTETTTSVWTNATDVAVLVYRGIGFVGAFVANGGAAGTTITYSALTLQDTGGTSWVVGFGGNATGVAVTAPTNMTACTNVTRLIASDTNTTATAWTSQSVTGNSSAVWRSYVVELRAPIAQPTGAGVPTLVQYRCTCQNDGASTSCSVWHVPFPNVSLSGNCLLIGFMASLGAQTLTSVKDDLGNSFTSVQTFHGASGQDYWLYALPNCAAGVKEVVITFTGVVSAFMAQLAEFYNVATSSPTDGTATGAETASGVAHQPGSITTVSDGDVIWSVAFQTGSVRWDGALLAPGDGQTLVAVESGYGSMQQYGIQATHAAINPIFYPLGDNTWGMVACALKAATAGTAPAAGIRVFGIQDYSVAASATAMTIQQPCTGNLCVTSWDGYCGTAGTNCQVSSITDTQGNTWTSRVAQDQLVNGVGTVSYSQQILDTGAATTQPSPHYLETVTINHPSGGSTLQFFDIVGAASAPFDTAVGAINTVVETHATFNTVAITPTTSNGLVIVCENQDTGTVQAGTGGTTYKFTSAWGKEMTGGFNSLLEDRGTAHTYNTTTAQITYGFTVDATAGQPGFWAAVAAAYVAAPASAVPYARTIKGRPFPYKPGAPQFGTPFR